jgi:hypothetical protein
MSNGMPVFADLTEYSYHPGAEAGRPKNVGWLGPSGTFDVRAPAPDFLERLWQYCQVWVAHARGVHTCPLCLPARSVVAERDGKYLLLGAAEIRVVSRAGKMYAAPNLIYHYVAVHHYAPPAEFEQAVMTGLSPSNQEYLDRLSQLGLSWHSEPASAEKPVPFLFVRTPDGGVKRVEES